MTHASSDHLRDLLRAAEVDREAIEQADAIIDAQQSDLVRLASQVADGDAIILAQAEHIAELERYVATMEQTVVMLQKDIERHEAQLDRLEATLDLDRGHE